MLNQLPLRLLTAGIIALLWGLVTRDAWFGGGIFVITMMATASREREAFGAKLQRALVIGTTLAMVRLYSRHNAGR